MPKKQENEVITIPALEMKQITISLVGITGLFVNRMTAKAKRQLLIGGRPKTAAERAKIKHDPRAEFREAMFVDEGWHEHSHVRFPAMAIKNAMGTAALSTPGIRKTDVSRLVFMPAQHVPIFGIPALHMGVMRSADIKRTPDIRTRPYFPRWGTQVTIRYSTLVLSQQSILTLLNNAGTICGIGDERQEKGKGSAGTFEVANSIPAELLDRDTQWSAIENPQPYDAETAELLKAVDEEMAARAN